MNNFEFHAPTKIIFGRGQIAKIKETIPANSRVLMTYGQGSIKQNGVYNQVKSALKDHQVFEFGGIGPNPEYDYMIKALPIIKENKIDFLLSVGGGSVIDATKFLAAAACYQGPEPWDVVTHSAKIQSALPHASVLTLAATGTEMNRWGVLSRRSIQAKLDFEHPSLFLQFVVLDPSTTFSLPHRQITNGIVDAFTHVMEQYITYYIDAPLQDRLAEATLVTLIEEGRRIIADPHSYEARANFMWAATMALNGLIEAGATSDWTAHKIGQRLTVLYDLDHGVTLAVVLPATMKVLREQKRDKLVQYARKVWGLQGADDDQLINEGIRATEEFFMEVGAKTRLRDYGIGRDDFQLIADSLEAFGFLPLSERQNVGKDLVIKILETCY